MPRKLIHSVRASVVAFGLLASALVVGTIDRVDAPNAADNGAEIRTGLSVEADTNEGVSAPAQGHRRKQARDAMALPFVSFARVLRRGNGG